jgi:hypothetical protein
MKFYSKVAVNRDAKDFPDGWKQAANSQSGKIHSVTMSSVPERRYS